jgi:hypothetical protein
MKKSPMAARMATVPAIPLNKTPDAPNYSDRLKPKAPPAEKVQSYNVTVETGDVDGQGTDANVFITLVGAEARSKRTMLREDPDNFTVRGCMRLMSCVPSYGGL